MELQKIKDLYQKLLEAAPDAMVFVEKTGRIVLVNAQMERLFGYTRGELMGKDLHMLIPERFRGQHQEKTASFFADPRPRLMGSDLKIYALKKDGTEFRADISLSPLDIDGELLITAAIRDITERVHAEEQIELDYRIQRVISAILKIALEPTSLDNQLDRILDLIVSIPDPALQAKGLIYLFDDAVGALVLKAHHGFAEREEVRSEEEPLAQSGIPKGLSCEIAGTGSADSPCQMLYRSSSSIHYCIPICEGEKVLGLISIFARQGSIPRPQEEMFLRAVAHTLAIIIKRNQIENEKQKLLEDLSQSETFAALGRLSANVAHEIRNPLTVVGGFARRLQRRTAAKTQEREYADFIIAEVNRLEEILKDVLTYSKSTALVLKEERIDEVVDDVLQMYEEAGKARSITVEKSYGFVREILIDSNRVREVMINVVSNALDAMADGGTLRVSTALEEVRGRSFVVVTISDTGEGMQAEILPKIFEPFFTTKVAKRGIGLGLSITKKIMEDHEGFIKVRSKEGMGSTFSLYFPFPGNLKTDARRVGA